MKYCFTKKTKMVAGTKLHQIRATRSFGEISKGETGGYIESKKNLSQEGDCWVYANSTVTGHALVCDNAIVSGYSTLSANARAKGNARVTDSHLKNRAVVMHHAVVENSMLIDDAVVSGEARCYNSTISEKAEVGHKARVTGTSVMGSIRLYYGETNFDVKKDIIGLIKNSLNICPVKGKYLFFKKVNILAKGKYASLHDTDFIYRDGKEAGVLDADLAWEASCTSGLHVSTANYWKQGDTLIAVEVLVKDVITCQAGKVRCKRLKVIGECQTNS